MCGLETLQCALPTLVHPLASTLAPRLAPPAPRPPQVPWQNRGPTVADLIRLYCGAAGKTLGFVETKKEADELAVHPALVAVGAKVMHGDVAQAQRESTLAAFRKGTLRCIVATDVAARGLDIKGVDLVVQTQPPAGKFSGRAEVRGGGGDGRGVCGLMGQGG